MDDADNSSDQIQELATLLLNIQATRFLSVAGVVSLIWDHLLTFDDEVEYVWKARWTLPKVLFLLLRYLVPAALLLHTYQMSGLSPISLTDNGWIVTGVYLGVLSIGVGNFLVLLRLWVIWDRNIRLVCCTMAIFVATQLATIATTTDVVVHAAPSVVWDPNLLMCVLEKKANLMTLWIPGIVFETMVFITACWNALSQPRGTMTGVTYVLYRDGFGYFMVLTVLRIFNLVLSIIAPLSLMFLGLFFIWSATTITVTRLILNFRKVSAEGEREGDDEGSSKATTARSMSVEGQVSDLDVEQYELPER